MTLNLQPLLSIVRAKHSSSPCPSFLFQSICLLYLIEVTPNFEDFLAKTVSSLRIILLAPPFVGVSPLQVL